MLSIRNENMSCERSENRVQCKELMLLESQRKHSGYATDNAGSAERLFDKVQIPDAVYTELFSGSTPPLWFYSGSKTTQNELDNSKKQRHERENDRNRPE